MDCEKAMMIKYEHSPHPLYTRFYKQVYEIIRHS